MNLEDYALTKEQTGQQATQPFLYAKKPLQRMAIRYDGSPESRHSIEKFVGKWVKQDAQDASGLYLLGANGTMEVFPGDWVIQAGPGDFYPCDHNTFIQTYHVPGEPETIKL